MRNNVRRLAILVSFFSLGIFLCTKSLYAVMWERQFGAENDGAPQYGDDGNITRDANELNIYTGSDTGCEDYLYGSPFGSAVYPNIGYATGKNQSASIPNTDGLIGTVGGSLCFISSTQKAFNQHIMGALAFLGFVVVLWRLIRRIRVYASRRQPSTKGPAAASKAHDKRQKREAELDLGEHPNAAVINQNMAHQVQRIWHAKTSGVEQDLHEIV